MLLTEAIQEIQATKRSKTFVFASIAKEMPDKLEWLKENVGHLTIQEILEARED